MHVMFNDLMILMVHAWCRYVKIVDKHTVTNIINLSLTMYSSSVRSSSKAHMFPLLLHS